MTSNLIELLDELPFIRKFQLLQDPSEPIMRIKTKTIVKYNLESP